MTTTVHTGTTWHYAVFAGTCAVAIWLLAAIKLEYSLALTATTGISMTLAMQWFVALICAPAFVAHSRLINVVTSALGIIVIPWPLLALCLQMSDFTLGPLLAMQVLILASMFASYSMAVWLRTALPPVSQPLAMTGLQILPALILLLTYRDWYGLVLS